MTGFQVLSVGEPFDPDRAGEFPEGTQLGLDGQIRFTMFLSAPKPEEVAAVAVGEIRFAWTEDDFNGYLLYRFGDQPWSNTPFNPQRAGVVDLVPVPEDTHRTVLVILVDSDTGLVAAMRLVSWPGFFVNTVAASLARLSANPTWTELAAVMAHDAFDSAHPNGMSLRRLTAILPKAAKCVGGQKNSDAGRLP